MITCVIVLALLSLLIATDPGPGESSFPLFAPISHHKSTDRNHPRR
jgi:hypothetical protein